MLKKSEFFKLGFIRKTHGVKGEMMLLCEVDVNFEEIGGWLFFNLDECLIPFRVESLRSATDKTVLFNCKSIDSIEKAAQFIETDIYLPLENKANVVSEDSPNALIGFKVFDESTDQSIGTIAGFIDNPHNPLLEIDHHGDEVLLPFQEEFILGVDQQTLFVKIPEGLLELEQ